MPAWREQIQLIIDGESVRSSIANRPLRQLAERTQYLKDRLDSESRGEGLTLFSQPIAEEVQVGHAVYYDDENDRYDLALAAIEDDDGVLRNAATAYVVGVVSRKISTSSADILIYGRAAITLNDPDDQALPEGPYYLSSSNPGFLTATRPPVGIFVATVTAQGVVVNPTPRESIEEHVHYRFDLLPSVAGFSLCVDDNRVEIVNADSNVEGWLPADDPVFNGSAPAGAKFGYNWQVNVGLAAVWPPQPFSSAYLDMDGVGVHDDHFRVDVNGIWWMTDCRGYVPWAGGVCNSSSSATPVESSSSNIAELDPCLAPGRTLTLWYSRPTLKTAQAVVTGLKSADDSPIVIIGCESPPDGYCRGLLELNLEMPWSRVADAAGDEVVKDISGHGVLSVGYIVEGIRGDGLIEISGTRDLDDGYKAGRIVVTGVDPTQITRQLDVSLVSLDGATESIYADVLPFVGLPFGRLTRFTGKLRIPNVSMLAPRMQLDIWFGLPTTGTPPAGVTLEYAIVDSAVPAVESSLSSLSLLTGANFKVMPSTWSSPADLLLDELGQLEAGEYFSRVSLDIPVHSNQIVLFRVSRAGIGDGYAGELIVVNMIGTVYEG